MPFKLSIKKKLTNNNASNERSHQKDLSLLSILQKQTVRGSKPNRNLKIVREHKKVEPNAFYQQPDMCSTRRRITGDKKNKINLKLKRNNKNEAYYNSTILLKTPHNNSNENGCEHHNLSARTLETKNSFNNLNRKFSKGRKRSVKRRMNQTTSIEDRIKAK